MIVQNPEFLLLLPLVLLAFKDLIWADSYGRKILISRIFLITLLVAAAASPSITWIEDASSEQKLNILVDNTTSTKVLETADFSEDTQKKVFVSGNTSNIFSQTAESIEEGSYNLLVTDAQTDESVEELAEAANGKNATISVYNSEEKRENAVQIEGPSTTVPEAKNSFTVEVLSSKEEVAVPLNITLDGEVIFSGAVNNSYSFQRTFKSKGEHTLQAHISSEDVFSSNNNYYKTVSVTEKPKIVSVGDRGLLEDELEEFYEVKNFEGLPESLESYYAVLMKEPIDNQELRSYLAEGNGLVYTGGMKEEVPGYLPLQKSEKEEGEPGARIIILIDNSASTGSCEGGGQGICFEAGGEGTVSKESIKIAYSLVDSLEKNNEVGVVAYNTDSFLVSKPTSLAFNREDLKSKIARITPQGNSFHHRGLRGAASLTERNDTVVMLSDGKISNFADKRGTRRKSRNTASNMEAKLITVGMGESPNTPFLEDLAQRGDGYYLENNEAGRLKFRFGAGGGESKYTPLKVVNPDHFITDGMDLDGDTTGFDPVDPEPSASKLVAGSNGKEFLTTWRYGLGRVAAFSAGQPNLDRTLKSDPELVSRAVSWTVGNPKRKKDRWLEVEDSSMPDWPEVRASYQEEGLEKRSKNLYTADISRPELGLHEWRGENYAYNYHQEKGRVGLEDQKLEEIAQETGGRVFDSGDIDLLYDELGRVDKKVERRFSLSPFILVLALLLFLAEVGYRKRSGRL